MYATSVSRRLAVPRSAVYRTLLDPAALAQWRVPVGMTSHVEEFDAREGGAFRISLTYEAPGPAGKSSVHTDTYHGHFIELRPDEKVVETMEFETDDPAMRGVMTMTTTLVDVGGETEIRIQHEGVPDAIPAADNEAGMRMALDNLAELLTS